MRVDLVDRGARHRSADPTRSLAVALAAAGHRVRLLSAEPLDAAELPGVERLRLRAGRRGGAGAPPPKLLGPLLDPGAAALVLPFEIAGAVPWSGGPALLAATLPSAETPEAPPAASGFFAALFGRRAARRDEQRALGRARWVLAPGEGEREAFLKARPKEAARTVVVPPTVPDPPERPDRGAARRLLHIPDDVPVAAAYVAPGGDGAVARAAFQRARVFFPGARILLVGASAPSEPGLVALPAPDAETRAAVLPATDVLLAPPGAPVGPVLEASRWGLATIVSPGLRLPRAEPEEAVRRPEAEDAGAYASDLAELFADPALRRRLGEAARSYGAAYAPARVAEEFGRLFGAGASSGNSSSR